MKKQFFQLSLLFCLIAFGILACKKDNPTEPGPEPTPSDDFNRTTLLTDWADLIIIPAYTEYVAQLTLLQTAKDAFRSSPDIASLNNLRTAWLAAYTNWQRVSMFEIGKAEANSLRNYTNIFPTDPDQILANIQGGDYNLTLPSNFDAQGFPALDYLLYGIGTNETEVLTNLTATSTSTYLTDLVDRLHTLAEEVLDDWQNGYREDFIANNGSSGTSSVDKLVNDFLFYYEKFLRAGKVGIPAGVFSGSKNSLLVEAPYSGEFSQLLFNVALDAVTDFFNGKSLDNQTTGESLASYLNYLEQNVDREDLSGRINAQWDTAKSIAAGLQPDFRAQIEEDHIKMLQTYDELQKAVVLLKVEMMQALNIRVDYVDADGD